VAAHAFLIGSVFFQEVKKVEPPPPLLKVRRYDMEDPESLLKSVIARKNFKFFLDGDHFAKWMARAKPGVELKKHVGSREVAYRYPHINPLWLGSRMGIR